MSCATQGLHFESPVSEAKEPDVPKIMLSFPQPPASKVETRSLSFRQGETGLYCLNDRQRNVFLPIPVCELDNQFCADFKGQDCNLILFIVNMILFLERTGATPILITEKTKDSCTISVGLQSSIQIKSRDGWTEITLSQFQQKVSSIDCAAGKYDLFLDLYPNYIRNCLKTGKLLRSQIEKKFPNHGLKVESVYYATTGYFAKGKVRLSIHFRSQFIDIGYLKNKENQTELSTRVFFAGANKEQAKTIVSEIIQFLGLIGCFM